MEKFYTVHLLNDDKLPKFISKIGYLEVRTTLTKRNEVEEFRKSFKKYKRPTKAECEVLRDTIEQKLLDGELSYDDSPRIKSKAITNVIGCGYPGLASLVVRIAIILEMDD